MSEESVWFVRKGNNLHGPFSASKLRQLADQQRISRSDLLRRGTDGAWVAGDKVNGLFKTETETPRSKPTSAEPLIAEAWPPVPPPIINVRPSPLEQDNASSSAISQAENESKFPVVKRAPRLDAEGMPTSSHSVLDGQTLPHLDLHSMIALWIAGLGMVSLALSPFFRWINFGAGGVTGLGGVGAVVIGVTVLAMCVFLFSVVKRKWILFSGVQAWGTIAAFFMGERIWSVGSILRSPEVANNPFAAIFASQVSAGVGLYFGLIGGLMIAGALAFLLIKTHQSTYYFAQAVACIVGIVICMGFVPDQAFRGAKGTTSTEDAGNTFSSLLNQSRSTVEREPPTVKLQQSITLGNLEVRPIEAQVKEVLVHSFGEPKSAGPFLVLTFTAKNLSEGQVFRPFSQIEGKDSFGNSLDDKVGMFDRIVGSDSSRELQPGQVGRIIRNGSRPRLAF